MFSSLSGYPTNIMVSKHLMVLLVKVERKLKYALFLDHKIWHLTSIKKDILFFTSLMDCLKRWSKNVNDRDNTFLFMKLLKK